jgi:hypothetical protein
MIYPATYTISVLQNSTYKMRVVVRDAASAAIDLTGYVIDADIKTLLTNEFLTTFTVTVINAATGTFDLELLPAATVGLEPGKYGYDLSLTSSGGERYYWLKGDLLVLQTFSRNS